MTTEERNKECEERSNIRDLDNQRGVILSERQEFELDMPESVKLMKVADKNEERIQREKIKQCLNHQHCQGFAGCAKDMYGKPISGYTLNHPELCFDCNHWEGLIEKIDDPEIYSIRIEGRHYQTHKNSLFRRPGKYNGFGGRLFVIKLHPTPMQVFSDGTMIKTYNLWTQGIIPEYFRDRLPDNASFINEVTETVVFDGEEFITAFEVKAV